MPAATKRSSKGESKRRPGKMAKPSPGPSPSAVEPPAGFRIVRETTVGRHPILEVFPGLDQLATAARQVPGAKARSALHRETQVEIVDGDVWMYVAPRQVPRWARARWKPVASPDTDCIVVGLGHLTESPSLTLFLDI
ncbi:MAG: hypothetical protein L3K08_01600, partial [Thermoplasmata archaeon]|nr:hypothetical protein [Thermoplasmata archaeon]